jgi:hypothetical protein
VQKIEKKKKSVIVVVTFKISIPLWMSISRQLFFFEIINTARCTQNNPLKVSLETEVQQWQPRNDSTTTQIPV